MNRFREFDDREEKRVERRRPQPQPRSSRHGNQHDDDFDPRRFRGLSAEEIVAMIDEGDAG